MNLDQELKDYKDGLRLEYYACRDDFEAGYRRFYDYSLRKINEKLKELNDACLRAEKATQQQSQTIPCEVVGMNERFVKVATVDDHRWYLSLDLDAFGGEFPKMGERLTVTLNREEA